MYIPFTFEASTLPEIPYDGLVSWLGPRSYPGSGSIWYDQSGNNVNALISGSLSQSGTDWLFSSQSYLDFGTGSYPAFIPSGSVQNNGNWTFIIYGTLNDNDNVQGMWSKKETLTPARAAIDIWWVPFSGSYRTFVDPGFVTGSWTGSQFQISAGNNGGLTYTNPDTPLSGAVDIIPVFNYDENLNSKKMISFAGCADPFVPADRKDDRFYINDVLIQTINGGNPASLQSSGSLYFGKTNSQFSPNPNKTWPNINQPIISDIFIYRYALTTTQIGQIYTWLTQNR